MDDRLIVTASPHIRDNATTRGLMGNVLIALVPSIVASGLIFGMRAILLTAVTTLACVVFEYLYCKLMHKPNPVGDLSACVTGVILALNMPVSMPLWIAIVGALVAIVIIKQLFGGLGYNFANPALVGRIVLFLGFTSRMTAYVYPDMSVDALASATPLNAAVDLHSVSFVDMLLGIHGGMMGETCVIDLIVHAVNVGIGMVVPHQISNAVGLRRGKAAFQHHGAGRGGAELFLISARGAAIGLLCRFDSDIMHIGSSFQNFQRCGIHPLLPGNQRSKAVHLDKVLDAGRIRCVICNHMQSKVIQFCHVLFPLSFCYKSCICLYCTAPLHKSKGQFSFFGGQS